MSPALPHWIVESRHDVCGNAKGKRLWRAQVCAHGAGSRQPTTKVKSNQVSLHRRGRQGYKGDDAVSEIKLRVEPQVIFNVVIRRPVGSAKLEGMRASGPGHVIFKLITFLVGQVGKERRTPERGSATRTGSAQIAQAEIDPVIVKWNRI